MNSLRQFCRAARRPGSFRSQEPQPIVELWRHIPLQLFLPTSSPGGPQSRSDRSQLYAYCDRHLRVRLRAKCTGSSGFAPVTDKKYPTAPVPSLYPGRAFPRVRRWTRVSPGLLFLMVGGQAGGGKSPYHSPTYHSPPAIHHKPRQRETLGQSV